MSKEEFEVHVGNMLKDAHDAAFKRLRSAMKSGAVDWDACDMIEVRALATALLDAESGQLEPPGTSEEHLKRYSRARNNFMCVI